MKAKKILLFSLVYFLMVICFYKTANLLHIDFSSNTQNVNEDTKITYDISAVNMIGTNSGNFMQTKNNSRGIASYSGDYFYYNKTQGDKTNLVRLDCYTQEEDILMTGLTMKNISEVGDYVIGTITIANGNDILKDYVTILSKHGDSREILYKTESENITSIICSSNMIYYTNETNSIYGMSLKEKEPSSLIKLSSKKDSPILFGLSNSKLYFVDGTSISTYDLEENTTSVITTDYTSVLQQPILLRDSIYVFSDLNKKEIHMVNTETGVSEVFITEEQLKPIHAESFNVGYGYVFISNGEEAYYSSINNTEELLLLKGFSSTDNALLMTTDSIVTIDKEATFFPINWILSQ